MTPSAAQKSSLGFLALFAVTGQFFIAQPALPHSLWIGLFFYACALWELRRVPLASTEGPLPMDRTELGCLFGIFLLAAFLRLYHIGSLPAGMHTDQGFTALLALRIEHEGWRPFFELYDYEIPIPLAFYELAAWFRLAGDSLFSFHLFFVVQSLVALAFFYGVVRSFSGPRIALLSLFILAATRWNWIETRTGYPSGEVAFFLFGALFFWLYGFQVRRIWPFAIAGAFTGLGLYFYQSLKLLPFLFLVYSIWEVASHQEARKRLKPILAYFATVLLFAIPFLLYIGQEGGVGYREESILIFHSIARQKSLEPLIDVALSYAGLFNRLGDPIARHNIPGHRMLDDITGALFILGLALAWRVRRTPGPFYFLAGFGVLLLTGLLADQLANSNRLVILTAFIAYFAALALAALWDQARRSWDLSSRVSAVLLSLILAALLAQNFYTYFFEQADNEECRWSLGLEQETLGKDIAKAEKASPGRTTFFVPPSDIHNHVVSFLDYAAQKDILPLSLTALAQGDFPRDKDAVFFLDTNKNGDFAFLKTLFPGGRETFLTNAQGHIQLYRYDVPQKTLARTRLWQKGLRGTYWNSTDLQTYSIAQRIDPVLNFTSKWDFPFKDYPPFTIRWSGQLEVPETGDYRLKALSNDNSSVLVDGKTLSDKPVHLRKGTHVLKVHYQKLSGTTMALSLIWKRPGMVNWEVIPATAFGTELSY